MTNKTNLFGKGHLSDLLRHQEDRMYQEINSIKEDDLLATSIDDWCDHYFSVYYIESVVISDDISTNHDEVNIDVNRYGSRDIFDRSAPLDVKGISVKFYVTFKGEEALLDYTPSSFRVSQPSVVIQGREIVFEYREAHADGARIKNEFQREHSALKINAENIDRDIAPFNDAIREKARRRLEARRETLLANRSMVKNLGFPLRERADSPKTYIAPQVKRKITPVTRPKATSQFSPEPALEMDKYEHILSVMQNMVVVMERSPKAFSGMGEEDLRQHFLVQLNGHYEGQATGETFNYEGKTDILIRVEGKNIFIGECKIWGGKKELLEAIDQILGYLAWRDTKTSILVFSRNKDTSAVVSQIPGIVSSHPNFKRQLDYDHESGFRCVLHQNGDVNREVILTVLVFDVPA